MCMSGVCMNWFSYNFLRFCLYCICDDPFQSEGEQFILHLMCMMTMTGLGSSYIPNYTPITRFWPVGLKAKYGFGK